MYKFTKKDLAEVLVAKYGYTKKEAAEVVTTVFDTIVEKLAEGVSTDISGFGKFVVKTRASRVGINPATGEKIEIGETKIPSFKASKTLKETIK